MSRTHPILSSSPFRVALIDAVQQRQSLIRQNRTQAFRAFSGVADGVDGVFVDVYGEGAVLIVYEGRPPRSFDPATEAATVFDVLKPLGVKAVYIKPFAKDRSRLGGELPDIATNPVPAAGETLPEAIVIREANWKLEIRLYDGLSTGLFLDQRENRVWLADWCAKRTAAGKPSAVLNTFAYTCAFSIAAATGGAVTTSVDVSGRYLDWAKRSFVLNNLDIAGHRFAKMDTFEFFNYAGRKGLKYDMIVLDPPSFASGSKKKKIRPWSSVDDYARLVHHASHLLNRGGTIFASTNTQALCRGGQLDREINKGLGRKPKWIELPAPPVDFSAEQDRFAARAFTF
ncbi:class I SAM-dependent rRNA methyltransferase [soil metagenome]